MAVKTKVNITVPQLVRDIKVSSRVLLELSEFWAKRIYSFTKLGNSLVTGEKLEPLKPSYVAARKKYKGARGELFGVSKSNLTRSGQLLNSLKGSANATTQRITVNVIGTRDDGISNSDLAKWMAEGDKDRNRLPRPFLGLDPKGKARMTEVILRDLRRTLKRRKPGK